MGETLGLTRRDHLPPFFYPLYVTPPFPGADTTDGRSSTRVRLHSRICASVIAPTPMAAAHGLPPTFPAIRQSRDRRPTGLTVTFPALLTRGDSESPLGLNRRELVQVVVSLAHKRDPEISYLRHIASVHV